MNPSVAVSRFNWIIASLNRVLAVARGIDDACAWFMQRPSPGNQYYKSQLYKFFLKTGRRFAILCKKLEAGQVYVPSRPRTRKPRDTTNPSQTPRVLPRFNGWVVCILPEASLGGGMMISLLQEPGMVAFIESDPRIARILRPWRHAFGVLDSRMPKCLHYVRKKPAKKPAESQPVTDTTNPPAQNRRPDSAERAPSLTTLAPSGAVNSLSHPESRAPLEPA